MKSLTNISSSMLTAVAVQTEWSAIPREWLPIRTVGKTKEIAGVEFHRLCHKKVKVPSDIFFCIWLWAKSIAPMKFE